MKWLSSQRSIAASVCIMAICAVVFLCAELSVVFPDNSSAIAGWVQAIGSIVAIISGFWVADRSIRMQHKQTLEKEKEEARRRDRIHYLVIADRMNVCNVWARAVLHSLEAKDIYGCSDHVVMGGSIVESLKSIGIESIPSTEAVFRINLANMSVSSLITSLDKMKSDEDNWMVYSDSAKERAQRILAGCAIDEEYFRSIFKEISTVEELDAYEKSSFSRLSKVRIIISEINAENK